MPRMATIKAGTVAGIVNHDGEKDHPYGAVEFLGPLPDDMGLEWVGKSAKSLQEQLDKDKPTVGARVGTAMEAYADAVLGPKPSAKEALTSEDKFRGGGDALHVNPKENAKGPVVPVEPQAPMTAAKVLAADKAGDLKYFTFVKEAKRILGKDYPESEEKGDIVKALEKKAGNPA